MGRKPNYRLQIYTSSWLCEYTEPCIKSLDVGTPYFFYNYKFRDRDDVGAYCNSALGARCNTLTVEQIVGVFWGGSCKL